MNNNLIIRPIGPEDLPLVETFFDRMTGESKLFFNHNDCNRIHFRKLLDGQVSDMEVFIAVDPDANLIAGTVFLFHPQCALQNLGIAVDSAYGGQGLGVRLMEFIHNYARKKGVGGLMLNVHFANTRAQSLYLKMGYSYYGTSLLGQMLFIKRFLLEE